MVRGTFCELECEAAGAVAGASTKEEILCESTGLLMYPGICTQRRDAPESPSKVEELWRKSSVAEKCLAVGGTVLVLTIGACLCTCTFTKYNPRIYLADLLVALVAFVLLVVAIEVSGNGWVAICATVNAVSVLPVPHIIRTYHSTLANLNDPVLPEHKTYIGPVGLCLFIFGLVDFVIDISFCYSLWTCDQHVLAACCTATVVVTSLMAWYLGWYTLSFVVRNDQRQPSATKAWLSSNPIAGPLIVLASSSRLNSMAILRLQLFGRKIVDFPDSNDHRFFHFLRNAGMFHYLVECAPSPTSSHIRTHTRPFRTLRMVGC